MLHHIQFSDKVRSNESYHGYELRLPSLKGKRFDFKPGLNVIVGKNGCGKTSLLYVIRKLTFCDGSFSSDIARNHGEWMMHRRNIYEGGYWKDVELVGDYKNCVWNLRKNGDIEHYDINTSAMNLMQHLHSNSLSDGEQVSRALSMMVSYMMYGYEDVKSRDVKKGKDSRSFKKCVLDVIERSVERVNNYWSKMFEDMLEYYKRNSIDTSKNGEYSDYAGIPILLDEPDKGLDVFNVNDIYKFLTRNTTGGGKMQIICVLHNIGMIHKLKSLEAELEPNFIELSDGYVETVEEFFK